MQHRGLPKTPYFHWRFNIIRPSDRSGEGLASRCNIEFRLIVEHNKDGLRLTMIVKMKFVTVRLQEPRRAAQIST
jgi:hypothetical protein